MKKLFLGLILMFGMVINMAVAEETFKEIEAKNLPVDAFILDVRTPVEIAEISLVRPYTVMELDKLDAQKFIEANNFKDKEIYILCNSGGRARAAAKMFAEADYKNTTIIKGGIQSAKEQIDVKLAPKDVISVERQIKIIAGIIILLGFFLAFFVAKIFFIIPVFVGFGLLYAGITGDCYMATVLSKMPWN